MCRPRNAFYFYVSSRSRNSVFHLTLNGVCRYKHMPLRLAKFNVIRNSFSPFLFLFFVITYDKTHSTGNIEVEMKILSNACFFLTANIYLRSPFLWHFVRSCKINVFQWKLATPHMRSFLALFVAFFVTLENTAIWYTNRGQCRRLTLVVAISVCAINLMFAYAFKGVGEDWWTCTNRNRWRSLEYQNQDTWKRKPRNKYHSRSPFVGTVASCWLWRWKHVHKKVK